jgi:tetratricopeptide (TPR) repeat protein
MAAKNILVSACVICALGLGACTPKKVSPEASQNDVKQTAVLQQALADIDSGRYRVAVVPLEQLAATGDPKVLNSLGACYLALGKNEQAAAVFEKVVELLSGSGAAYINLGKAYFALGQYGKAHSAFERAERLGAVGPALLGQASCSIEEGHSEEALRFLEQAEQELGKTPAVRFNRAIAFYGIGLYAESLRLLDELLAENKLDAQAINAKGLIYCKQKKYKAAVAAFSQALAIAPTEGMYYLNRGVANLAWQKFKNAENDLTYSLAYAPSLTQAYLSRAEARYLQKDKTGACEDLGKACEFGLCDRFELYQEKGLCNE